MAVQVEIGDDFGIEQRHRVGGDGISEAGMEFLGDGGAAQDMPAFEYRDLQAGPGEIGGADEPVMAAADDDDVLARSRA